MYAQDSVYCISSRATVQCIVPCSYSVMSVCIILIELDSAFRLCEVCGVQCTYTLWRIEATSPFVSTNVHVFVDPVHVSALSVNHACEQRIYCLFLLICMDLQEVICDESALMVYDRSAIFFGPDVVPPPIPKVIPLNDCGLPYFEQHNIMYRM